MALVVSVGSSSRPTRGRASAAVDHVGRRREEHRPAVRADCGAEVHILLVHEVAFVEESDCLGIRAPHEEARTAHPVDHALASGESLDVSVDDSLQFFIFLLSRI